MNSGHKISILGCGWLGLPLAEHLINLGFLVQGSTTTAAKTDILNQKGISPYLLDLKHEKTLTSLPNFLDTDLLIVAFPPGIRAGNGEAYLEQIKVLQKALVSAPVSSIIFISSTSVYPDLNTTVTEDEALDPFLPGAFLLRAENLFRELKNKNTTFLRLGGLVGGNRHPGRFLAGKENLPNPLAPVNLIHLDDCIALITTILIQNKFGEVYNGCADEHPSREVFYTAAAQKLGLPLPHFAAPAPTDTCKIVSNDKVKKDLSYRFIHPDPMLFI